MRRTRLALLIGLLGGATATAAPVQLTHQGRLLDATGGVIDGAHLIEVSLWAHATSDEIAAHRRYAEPFPGTAVESGYFSVVLGAGGGLDAAELEGPLWAQVSVDGVALLPRTPITAVPSAANGGVDLSVFDGVTRRCPNGGEQEWDGASASWSACPTAGTEGSPGASCEALKADHGFADGLYWLDRDGAGPRPPFQAWCEMDVHDGGWMLLAHIRQGSATNFMNLALPTCVDDQTACITRNVVNAGEMDEVLVFDRVNLNRWVSTQRASGSVSAGLIDLVSTGTGWGTHGITSFYFYDGVVRNAYTHHVDNGIMIDPNHWSNCTADSSSNVGSLCIACLRTDSYCANQPYDTLFYVR